MIREKFIGSWRLRSAEVRTANGQVQQIYGETPQGLLIYDPSGNIAVQIMKPGRKLFAQPDKSLGSADELKAAISGYEAYFGTFRVDEARGEVVHKVAGSLLPNWENSEQRRFFEISPDRLVLSTADIPYGGTTMKGVLVWERVA